MLILRAKQIAAIQLPQILSFVESLSGYLRENFTEKLHDISGSVLNKKILKSIKKAEKYGFTSRQDCCEFAKLAVKYGWDFDEEPQNEWMRKMLIDKNISNPSHRLARCVEEIIFRKEVEKNNRNLREKFYKEVLKTSFDDSSEEAIEGGD